MRITCLSVGMFAVALSLGSGPLKAQIANEKPPVVAPTDALQNLIGGSPALGGEPIGIDRGPFTFYPAITAGILFDDNMFATSNGRQRDWAFVLRPELSMKYKGQQSLVEAFGYIESRDYHSFDSEDRIDGAAQVRGIYQPNADTQLIGRMRYVHAHEDRGSVESLLATFDRPLAYDTYELAGAINRRFGTMWTSVGGGATWVHYETPTMAGVPVDQSYRDGMITTANARVGRVVAPLTSVFAELVGNRRNFEVNDFDSSGYRVVGGVLLEPGDGARVRGELFAGFMAQDYTGASLQTVSTWTFGSSLAFLLSPTLTGVLEGRRDALESGLGTGVSLVETYVAGRLDYKLTDKLVVGGGASYIVDEFMGVNRTDRSLSPLASIKYFMNPQVTLSFDYRHLDYSSNGAALLISDPYQRNVYLMQLNAKL